VINVRIQSDPRIAVTDKPSLMRAFVSIAGRCLGVT